MVKVFKTVKCSLEDFEILNALINQLGSCKLPQIKFCKMSDVIGLQTYSGDTYLGKTLLLSPCGMYYDKWGFPVYRFKRYMERTKQTSYNDYKTRHSVSWIDFE